MPHWKSSKRSGKVMDLKEWRTRVDVLRNQKQSIDCVVLREQKAVVKSQRRLDAAKTAIEVCQSVAETMQNEAHSRIASIVSEALFVVFGDDAYEFRIHFEKRRNRTEAKLLFKRNGLEVDPLTASGGGAVDVASFALRVAALVLSRPRRRRLLVLDEPFRFVSCNYWPALVELIKLMSDRLGIQFVIVTHVRELEIGKVIEL